MTNQAENTNNELSVEKLLQQAERFIAKDRQERAQKKDCTNLADEKIKELAQRIIKGLEHEISSSNIHQG